MRTLARRCRVIAVSGLVLLGPAGCSTLIDRSFARQLEAPVTPLDPVLEAIGDAKAGTPVTLPGGAQAVAEVPYWAASGRNCRRARLDYPDGRTEERLACETDGRWQWYPLVSLPQGS